MNAPAVKPDRQSGLDDIINTAHFPIHERDNPTLDYNVERVRSELKRLGCSVLRNFIRRDAVAQMRVEGVGAAPNAYHGPQTVNVYNTDIDAELPDGHPGTITFERGNAFVARDQIAGDAMITRLYEDDDFKHFVARCFGADEIHELADPFAGLVVNVLKPGCEYPWHFDYHDYTVSLLTQAPEAGGVFEYCRNIRSAEDEKFDDVSAVLRGEEGRHVKRMDMRPGDLQLFKGQYSMHRVGLVEGGTERHTALLCYASKPGVISSSDLAKQHFGRVGPEHLAAEEQAAKGDAE